MVFSDSERHSCRFWPAIYYSTKISHDNNPWQLHRWKQLNLEKPLKYGSKVLTVSWGEFSEVFWNTSSARSRDQLTSSENGTLWLDGRREEIFFATNQIENATTAQKHQQTKANRFLPHHIWWYLTIITASTLLTIQRKHLLIANVLILQKIQVTVVETQLQ